MKRLVKKTRIKAQGWNTNGRLLFLRRGDLGTDDMRQKQIRDLSRQPVGLPPFYFGSQVFPISKIGFFNPLQSTSMIVTVICQITDHFLCIFSTVLSRFCLLRNRKGNDGRKFQRKRKLFLFHTFFSWYTFATQRECEVTAEGKWWCSDERKKVMLYEKEMCMPYTTALYALNTQWLWRVETVKAEKWKCKRESVKVKMSMV